MHAFDAETGEPLASPEPTRRDLHLFQTLIAGEDRFYVAAADTICAFKL